MVKVFDKLMKLLRTSNYTAYKASLYFPKTFPELHLNKNLPLYRLTQRNSYVEERVREKNNTLYLQKTYELCKYLFHWKIT